jgi:hypothetical protein
MRIPFFLRRCSGQLAGHLAPQRDTRQYAESGAALQQMHAEEARNRGAPKRTSAQLHWAILQVLID